MCLFIFSFSDALPKPVEWVKFVKYHVNHSARHFRCLGPTPFPWHDICYRLYLGTIAYHRKGPKKGLIRGSTLCTNVLFGDVVTLRREEKMNGEERRLSSCQLNKAQCLKYYCKFVLYFIVYFTFKCYIIILLHKLKYFLGREDIELLSTFQSTMFEILLYFIFIIYSIL